VDTDASGKHLAELVGQHHNLNVAEAVAKVEFRDDRAGAFTPGGNQPLRTAARRIEASKVPMMVLVRMARRRRWRQTRLTRYKTFSNPQVVVIGPLSHGGGFKRGPVPIEPHSASPRQPRSNSRCRPIFFDWVAAQRHIGKPSSLQFNTTPWARDSGTRRRRGRQRDCQRSACILGNTTHWTRQHLRQ